MAAKTFSCSDGHIFTANTIQLAFLSAHFIDRLWLRCPADHKWRTANLVPAGLLSESELDEAKQHRFVG